MNGCVYIYRSFSSSFCSERFGTDISRSRTEQFQSRTQPQQQPRRRFFSSDTDDCAVESDHLGRDTSSNDIVADASDVLLLEKAAFTAKHVEFGVLQSVEFAIWKASGPAERRKMGRFLIPQLRNATEGLLNVTRDTELLSHSIEKVNEKKGHNTAAERSLRELHCAFLNLTQVLLDHLDDETSTREEGENDNNRKLPTDPLQLIELVLSISYRAHKLRLTYHLPLYQRLAIAVAEHPKIGEDKISDSMTTTLGCLVGNSRGEWIQTINSWSQTSFGSDSESESSNDNDHPVFRTDQNDLKWFRPSLKVLATGARWSDVWHILKGLLRPLPELTRMDNKSHYQDRNKECYSIDHSRCSRETLLETGVENEYDDKNAFSDQIFDDDDVILSSATTFPYLDEDLVIDILLPMEQQGLLADLWSDGGCYPPPKAVEDTCNIILMMEPSIWKIFGKIASHVKANLITNLKMDQKKTYSLQDAIQILLKNSERNALDDGNPEGLGEHFLDNHEKDSLVQALKELEDLLDEHLHPEDDQVPGNEEANQASELTALATDLSDEVRSDGSVDKNYNSRVHSRTSEDNSSQNLSDMMKVRVKRSGDDNIVEVTNVEDKYHQSTEEYLEGITDEDHFLYLIYDDRARNYEDNIPDISHQIYEKNGGKQLRYTASLERHIYNGMQQRLDYDSEEDDDIHLL
ncbi:unnamed protein product [Pseudo-nitzschia multistriata]|uniref:Uncharacterized protein n=1 Tax=Pseudo-nitzschia multistriata TaxID=183589 RepID=A0A448ZD98_9STRA|nr:unnamed protein product [Pseudo-nitzschia multistriata]